MQLFVIYIGGMHDESFIELHDMRFVIANSIEDTYDELKKTWWGIPESLHLDAWGVLRYADGHAIHLAAEPAQNTQNKLYFVNLGGYDKNQFTELHNNVFVVAENESQAKVNAVKQIAGWESPHRDNQYQIENIVDITKIAASKDVYIHLHPTHKAQEFEFTCRYVPIGRG